MVPTTTKLNGIKPKEWLGLGVHMARSSTEDVVAKVVSLRETYGFISSLQTLSYSARTPTALALREDLAYSTQTGSSRDHMWL